jgi:hypothetical protein
MSTIVCATVLAACGGGDEVDEGTIPLQTGENIVTKLDEVQSQVDDGECDTAEATAAQIQAAIAGINTVKGELEETLVEASGKLVTLVRDDCVPAEEPPDETGGATGEEGVAP